MTMNCMKRIGKNIKNVKQDLEAEDLTAREYLEGKPSSEKFNKGKINIQDAFGDL
jgi:hypothetical protein